MADKGIVNGKVLKTNTVDIRDSLNQFIYTTDLTKQEDLVNVAALNYVNNFNIIDGLALQHSQPTQGGYSQTFLQAFNVFKQKNNRKLEFRNIVAGRYINDGFIISKGVNVELYNDDIVLSVDTGWLRGQIGNFLQNKLNLNINNNSLELTVSGYGVISSIDVCDLVENCVTYSDNIDGLGSLV